MDNTIMFDMPRHQSSIIKVMGVGGGGSNAVTHMFNQGIKGVDFVISNTDAQALESSPVPVRIQLGKRENGAGSNPKIGRESAMESIEGIKALLEKNTKMLFITAGMGGGTGTGAAPVIAEMAKKLDVLTVAIVTLPFGFEGRRRLQLAEEGIEELKKNVDCLLLICNDKIREQYGNLKFSDAFHKADDVLTIAAKGIAEIITVTGYVNVDFEDVRTVMKDSGTAIMGSATAEGENRARKAVETALSSPLLNDNNISGAANILLNLTSGEDEITMDEVSEIMDYVQVEAGKDANIIWGKGQDNSLGKGISVTLIATGFGMGKQAQPTHKPAEKVVIPLDTEPLSVEVPVNGADQTISEITLINKDEKPCPEPEEVKPRIIHSLFEDEHSSPERAVITDSVAEESALQAAEPAPVYQQVKEETIHHEPVKPVEMKKDPERVDLMNDFEKKSQERARRLKELSMKLKAPGGLTEIENVPAYVRRNVELGEEKPSSESEVSHLSLTDGDDNEPIIKQNNSYIHDAAD
jgi:cell division protein FtsZ